MRPTTVTKMKARRTKWLPIAIGCFLTAAGLIMLKHAQVVTGGTAGLSLSLAHIFHLKFHYLLLMINAPFLVFSYAVMGRAFTLRTIIAIALLSLLTSAYPLIPYPPVPPLIGATAGGILIGTGVCLLFQYGASLGGSNILALYLGRRYRINPGKTNFLFDCFVLLISLSAYSLTSIVLSAISIAVTSAIIAIYKKTNSEHRHKDLRSLKAVLHNKRSDR
ncbi:YitT family protein [Paenibacillus harenae]|uniref:YitT family protein n=1 Tax=Paenibacillus harenae TaxID=306543 RepID=UPI00278E4DEC|nr:YitT family protein [Paenibacillus harenae]MDQ0062603.1 uncharacterized membrane-anchored protein YitT (DUF2179 family) [Paenibacillus harenae]